MKEDDDHQVPSYVAAIASDQFVNCKIIVSRDRSLVTFCVLCPIALETGRIEADDGRTSLGPISGKTSFFFALS